MQPHVIDKYITLVSEKLVDVFLRGYSPALENCD